MKKDILHEISNERIKFEIISTILNTVLYDVKAARFSV